MRAWAYRDGEIVCGRADVSLGRRHDDDRVGLAPRERRYVAVRFLERVRPTLRDDLERLPEARGVRGVRLSEALAPIELLVRDPSGEHRLIGQLEPPSHRFGPLEAIVFRLRERGRVVG